MYSLISLTASCSSSFVLLGPIPIPDSIFIGSPIKSLKVSANPLVLSASSLTLLRFIASKLLNEVPSSTVIPNRANFLLSAGETVSSLKEISSIVSRYLFKGFVDSKEPFSDAESVSNVTFSDTTSTSAAVSV